VAEGFCLGIHCRKNIVGLVMLENPVEVTEKAEEGAYIFSFGIGKGAAYKCKITAENESVAV